MWGVAQPISSGHWPTRYGSMRVIILGALMLAAGTALTPFMHSQAGLLLVDGHTVRRRRGRPSVHPDRRRRERPAGERRAFGVGLHQRRWLLRPVRVRAGAAGPIISSAGWVVAHAVHLRQRPLFTIPLAWPLRAAAAAQAKRPAQRRPGLALARQFMRLAAARPQLSGACISASSPAGSMWRSLVTHLAGPGRNCVGCQSAGFGQCRSR